MQTKFVGLLRGFIILLPAFLFLEAGAKGQVSVVTAHNDTARTGQNLNETTLNPSNVNVNQFGKLFTHAVDGAIFAQPLYVSQVPITSPAGASLGIHNIVIVATVGNNVYNNPEPYLGDSIYAFDADTNGGQNANALWSSSLLSTPVPIGGEYPYHFGVVGTPVINQATNTMYLVDAEMLNSVFVHRLHAINITNGLEEAGSPVVIQGSVSGTGSGSSNGVLAFDSVYQLQRSAMLLQNNIVYISFGSVNDEGPWHGWLFSYDASTLQQIDVFCTTSNGSGGGIWMGGSGLVGEVYNPTTKPYGRLFFATGNGSFSITPPTVAGEPYSNPTNSYGMSVVDMDLTNGMFTVEDVFSPYNEADLSNSDADLGSGGPILLPTQTLASGLILDPLIQIGKTGTAYILDRDDNNDGSNNPSTEYNPAGLGGFNAAGDEVVQEVQSPVLTGDGFGWGAGVWGTEAYWNGHIYSGGTNPGVSNSVTSYSFVNGVLSSAPTSQSLDHYSYPGPTPSISANGTSNAILWTLNHGNSAVLEAYDATDLSNLLYTSNQNPSRDSPGVDEEFIVPTIANGKVYVGPFGAVSAYGLLSGEPISQSPVITPGSTVFTNSVIVTITDPGATIYYTTDGSTPNPGIGTTQVYSNPIVVSANETITAIGSVTGQLQSLPISATYTSSAAPAAPTFSLAAGIYTEAQTLKITAPTGAAVYYTVDGSTPTSASLIYTQPITISATQTVQAVAVIQGPASSPGPISSFVTSATYIIQYAGSFNFSGGFALADGPIQFNGSTDLDDFRLQLTNGGLNEAGSAFYATPVNIQQFTTNFTFQLSNPAADGITFTIQNYSPTALGGYGGNLGYGGVPKSVAIKFDLYNNAGEGPDSTGLFINGATPTEPGSIDLSATGINLHSGDYFNTTLTYDGANLKLTLMDAITLASWSQVFVVNIPQLVGGDTAYVGFTGGTGGLSSSQKLTSWTYTPGPPLPSSVLGAATFAQIPGSLAQISVGADGSVWGVNSGQQIFRYDASSGGWTQIPGALVQVAVGSSTAVWGINAQQQIYQFEPATQNWNHIAGTLSQIAVGADGDVWGINGGGGVYHYVWAAQGWEYVPTALTQIAVGFDGAVWGLGSGSSTSGRNVYRYNVGTRSFEQVPGELSQIAVGADGDVWGVNGASAIFHFNTLLQNWELIQGSAAQISVGSAANVWGLDSSGNVYTFNTQAQTWTQIPGTLKQISAAANGAVLGINSADNIYQFVQPLQPTNAWHPVAGALLTQVAVSVEGNVWALDGATAIYHYNPLIQNWENVPGSLSQIAVGFGGDVWGINSGGAIYRYNSGIQGWENVPGELSQIAVGANGDVWGINPGGNIYRFNNAVQGWEQIPGSLKQLSVGADGTVWGINSAQQIFAYNPNAGGWTQIPGALVQIAVGSSSSIWGLAAGGNIYQFNLRTQNWEQIPGNLSQIAVGFDGTVWGINSGSQIYRYEPQLQGWDYIPGTLNQISVGADAVAWGVNSAHAAYRFW